MAVLTVGKVRVPRLDLGARAAGCEGLAGGVEHAVEAVAGEAQVLVGIETLRGKQASISPLIYQCISPSTHQSINQAISQYSYSFNYQYIYLSIDNKSDI